MKQLLVSGCSFTHNATWPHQLFRDYSIVNFAQSGAGNEYIARSIMNGVCKTHCDYVFILWSGIRRVDMPVPNNTTSFEEYLFKGTTENSVILFSGGDYTQLGNVDSDNIWPHPVADSIFKTKYQGNNQDFLIEQSSLWIMLCQTFLESRNIKYKFSFICNPFDPPMDAPALGPKIDKNQSYFRYVNWNNYIDATPMEYAIRHNYLSDDNFHPTPLGMNNWAQTIQHYITG
jgi:hypothetical protein